MNPTSWQWKRIFDSPIYFVLISVMMVSSFVVISPSGEYSSDIVFVSFMVVINAVILANDAGTTYGSGAIIFFLSHHSHDTKLQLGLLSIYVAESVTVPTVLLVFFWSPEVYAYLLVLLLYSVFYALIVFSIGSLSKSPLASILLVVLLGFLPFFIGFESNSNSVLFKETVVLSPVGGALLAISSTRLIILTEVSIFILIFLAISIYTIISGRVIR